MQAYSDPRRENDPHALPDVEIFYVDENETLVRGEPCTCHAKYHDHLDTCAALEPYAPGWYWWPCYPGCMPDSRAVGPFETEALALADAQDEAGDAS